MLTEKIISSVDCNLSVYGIGKLHIADAFIMRVTTGKTMAPCVVRISDRTSDISEGETQFVTQAEATKLLQSN
jgi:hypothetical protein